METQKHFYEEILKIQYHRQLENASKIAQIRNHLLKNRHSKLPSYCFWTPDDLALETLIERKQWMETFEEANPS